jgi:hypothetical protein
LATVGYSPSPRATIPSYPDLICITAKAAWLGKIYHLRGNTTLFIQLHFSSPA